MKFSVVSFMLLFLAVSAAPVEKEVELAKEKESVVATTPVGDFVLSTRKVDQKVYVVHLVLMVFIYRPEGMINLHLILGEQLRADVLLNPSDTVEQVKIAIAANWPEEIGNSLIPYP
jgi:hypothetical protein